VQVRWELHSAVFESALIRGKFFGLYGLCEIKRRCLFVKHPSRSDQYRNRNWQLLSVSAELKCRKAGILVGISLQGSGVFADK
jgi:hypothetical protein